MCRQLLSGVDHAPHSRIYSEGKSFADQLPCRLKVFKEHNFSIFPGGVVRSHVNQSMRNWYNNSSKLNCIRPQWWLCGVHSAPLQRWLWWETQMHLKWPPAYCPSSLLPPHMSPVYTRGSERAHSQRTDKQPSWYHPKELVVILRAERKKKSKWKKVRFMLNSYTCNSLDNNILPHGSFSQHNHTIKSLKIIVVRVRQLWVILGSE